MRLLLALLGVLLLAGCSKPDDQSPADRQAKAKPAQFHQYLVTFVAVKAPNALLQPYMTNAAGPDSIKVRHQIANYLLAHTNDFPIITPDGNFIPAVNTGHRTGGRFVLDEKREAAESEKTNLKVTRLEMNVDVSDEDDQGYVWYEGIVVYDLDFAKGGGVGGTISFPGGLLPVGQADLQPLYAGKDFTLCALVKLARAN